MNQTKKIADEILKTKKNAASTIQTFKTPQGIDVDVWAMGYEEYQIRLSSHGTTMLVKIFKQGKVVPDIKAEKKAVSFAKRLAAVLASDPS